ncbi:MAG: hypothetical protein U9Q04_10185 [Campylobacterota bacterium]|nr:hypothetical protein [Campylobacterota bacterium]
MMNDLKKLTLNAGQRIVDNKKNRIEQDRLRAKEEEKIAQSIKEAENQKRLNAANENKQKEIEERREAINKEIAYLDDELIQIDKEIEALHAPVVVDFTTSTKNNSETYNHSSVEAKKLKDEIYDKQSYSISATALLGLKFAITVVLASVVGKLTVSSPELVESLVAYTFFADIESLGESFGLFSDFLSQEFFMVFLASAALAWLFRDEDFIHNKTWKYTSIWIIVISLVSIILLSTL